MQKRAFFAKKGDKSAQSVYDRENRICVREGSYNMGKALFTFIVILLVGSLSIVIGQNLLNGFPEFGAVGAVAALGALIVFFINNGSLDIKLPAKRSLPPLPREFPLDDNK